MKLQKRIMAILLCACMAGGLLPAPASATGTGAIQSGADSIVKDNKVYFGQKGTTAVPWIALDNNGFLLSEYTIGTSTFRDSGDWGYYNYSTESRTVSSSNLKTVMDGLYNGNGTTLFTDLEQGAVMETSLAGGSMFSGMDPVDAHLFPLSRVEVQSIGWGSDLLKAKDIDDPEDGKFWSLRSSSSSVAVWYVDVDGGDGGMYGAASFLGVRPAFNLDPNSVLFTSAAAGGKAVSGMDSGLTAVSTATPGEWKLTLKDDSRSFTVTDTAFTGAKAFITYSGAETGANEYISAIVKDSSGGITYYGRLKHTTAAADANGTATIDLSGVTMAATDTLYVFSEQYNGGADDDTMLTDYASELVAVALIENAYAVTNTLTHITSDNTSAYRLVSETADYTATLSADTNYTLPASITVSIDGTTLTAGATTYEYNGASGALTIYAAGITGDIEITANGDGDGDTKDYYTLTFNTNGGSSIKSVTCAENARIDLTLPQYIPTRSGYKFVGWYADQALTKKITNLRMTNNAKIYAGWEKGSLPFSDVSENDWFHDGVKYVTDHGLMNGIGNGLFSPGSPLTREMLVLILYRMAGSPTVTKEGAPFSDVPSGSFYADSICWAVRHQIVKGFGDGTFMPGAPVTRAQLAAILHRYAAFAGLDVTQGGMAIREFSDYADIPSYATQVMTWCVNAGLLQGCDNKLEPCGTVTRAQIAVVLMRLCQKISK